MFLFFLVCPEELFEFDDRNLVFEAHLHDSGRHVVLMAAINAIMRDKKPGLLPR